MTTFAEAYGNIGTAPAIAKPPSGVNAAMRSWQARVPQLLQAGFDKPSIRAVFSYDMGRIQGGSRPLTATEALVATHAVQSKKLVMTQHHTQGGFLGFLGSIGSDVENLVANFVPGLWNFAKTVTSPKAWESEIAALSKGDFNLADHPLLRYLPVVNTLSNLMTAKGRAQIMAHPLFTALDVLPVASFAGKLAMFGREVEAGSAAEAFAEGNPAKGLFRVAGGKVTTPMSRAGADLLDVGKNLPTPSARTMQGLVARKVTIVQPTALPRTSELVNKIAENYGWDRAARQSLYQTTAIAVRKLRSEAEKADAAVSTMHDLTVEENNQLSAALEARMRPEDLPPHLLTIYDSMHGIGERATMNGLNDGELSVAYYKGEPHVFSSKHPVIKKWQSYERQTARVEQLRQNVGIDHPSFARGMTEAGKRYAAFEKEFLKNPGRQWYPLVYDATKQQYGDILKIRFNAGKLSRDDYEAAVEHLDAEGVAQAGDRATWKALVKDNAAYWYEQYKGGSRPTYVPNAAENTILGTFHLRPMPDRIPTPDVYKEANLFEYRPRHGHLVAQLHYRDMQIANRDISEGLVQSVGQSFGWSREKVAQFETARLDRLGPYSSASAKLAAQIDRNWVRFDEFAGRLGPDRRLFPDMEATFIPREVANAFDKRISSFEKAAQKTLATAPTRLYRFAVTRTPRHIVHINTSNMAFVAGDYGLGPFTKLIAGWKIADKLPDELPSRWAFDGIASEEIHRGIEGAAMGDGLLKSWRNSKLNPSQGMQRLEQHIQGMWQGALMLHVEDKLLGKGATAEYARFEAIKAVQQTMLNSDTMSPFEQSLTRYVFPFYPFTRQLMRYMFRYPADHPLAASMIARVGQDEMNNHQTGLPMLWNTYFPFGGVDGAGNQTFVDVKTLNPFRSIGNGLSPWTLAGITSAINPAGQTLLRLIGVDPLTASVNRFASTHVDPVTGTAVSDHGSILQGLFEDYVPQSQLLTSMLGMQNYLTALRKSNPDQYRKDLFSLLGVPFVPFKANAATERIKEQVAYYKQAQADVSAALKAGDLSTLLAYPIVPYKGKLVDPTQLAPLVPATS